MYITYYKYNLLIWSKSIFYYEIDENYQSIGYPSYIYCLNFDYFLSAISNRVFELNDKTLLCVSGDQTYYQIDPKEAIFIILSAFPYSNKLSNYFNPGHA